MHIGVRITPALDPSVADLARRAEEMGFASVWLSERVVTPLENHPYDPSIDPWIGLAYVAAVTSRVQLGTCVSQIGIRHPVIMARQLATLDRLSEGRVIVGAGAGWVREEFMATDVDFDTRGGRLAEAIRCMRHLWSTPDLGWEGRHFNVPPVKILQPATKGGPPFFVGASGSKGLRRAVLHGDGFVSVGMAPDKIKEIAEDMRSRRVEEGHTGHFPIYCQVNPPQSVDEGVALVRDYREAGADGLVLAEPMGRDHGFPTEDAISRAVLEAAAG